MVPADLRLFNPNGPDRVAWVSIEPAFGRPDAYLLRLARGVRTGQLTKGGTYGPYSEADLGPPHAELVTSLLREGFLPGGAHGAMQRLFSDSPAVRGRAATRLGWGGHPHSVQALLSLLPKAVDETCAIIDALGRIGDVSAALYIRPYATRKLLSRRRSAVEAMRNMGDGEGLMQARLRTLEELPPAVRDALLPLEPVLPTAEQLAGLIEVAGSGDPKRRGQTADLLYERGTPAAVTAATALVGQLHFNQPFAWRYVKSILKRAILRNDFRTFGWLMHEIEARGRVLTGSKHVVKSGYDGVDRPTRIFGRLTQNYLRRAAWRYLRNLAAHRPQLYSTAAAEALLHYSAEDAQTPRKLYGAFAGAYLLHRILWGGGKRYEFVGRSMKFRLRKGSKPARQAGAREEAYPQLWDAQPMAYLRVVAASRLVEVQEFAIAGIARHPQLLATASVEDLLGMLDSPLEAAVKLAMTEITRRFDPANPDWVLIDRLVMDPRAMVADLGLGFLRDHVAAWARDTSRIVTLLLSPSVRTRALVANLVILWLATNNAQHRALAEKLLAILRQPESAPGMHESLARVCREALSDALAAMISTDELLQWIASGSPAAQGVASDLLKARPEALGTIGIEGVAALAQNSLAAVRGAGHALLRSAKAHWAKDPSVLLVLVESEWPDTRAVALELLRDQMDFSVVGSGVVLGLLDSNRTDVQDTGIELTRRHFSQLDPAELVNRLVEHPHANMRQFALDLVVEHLPAGAPSLAGLERFCRTILLDTWPRRKAKNDLIAFLGERGLVDEAQAAVAGRILSDALALHARFDFERALAALTRIKLAYPQIESAVGLPPALIGGAG